MLSDLGIPPPTRQKNAFFRGNPILDTHFNPLAWVVLRL